MVMMVMMMIEVMVMMVMVSGDGVVMLRINYLLCTCEQIDVLCSDCIFAHVCG